MRLAVLALALAGPAFAGPAAPAPAAKVRVFPGLDVEFKTSDGWAIKAKHLPSKDGGKTVLLLHGTGGRKEDFFLLAKTLQKRGYGYLAVDFRGHGESRTAPDGQSANWRKFPKATKVYNEFENMIRDVEAAVAYLGIQAITEDSLVIIGADVGASLGLKYAAVHPKLPMVVMLSPGMKYQEVTTINAMRRYKDRPILFVYSEADKMSSHETPILYATAKLSTGESNSTVLIAPKEHGARMLRGPVVAQVLDWVADPVKPEALTSTTTAIMPPDAQPETVEDAGEEPDSVQ
ncbi:MAG: alpha/beta fold hydrolase [Elusimicrobiota bacterium]